MSEVTGGGHCSLLSRASGDLLPGEGNFEMMVKKDIPLWLF